MKLSDFQNEVSRRVDTAGTKINVAETKRVLAVAFDVLGELDGAGLVDVVAEQRDMAGRPVIVVTARGATN